MLSKNFFRWEFSCNDHCGFDTVDVELITVLQDVRNKFGAVEITSGNRCHDYNRYVGGAINSRHLESKAADFQCKDYAPVEIYNYLDKKYSDKYGIGLYSSWIHIDVRPEKARWSEL